MRGDSIRITEEGPWFHGPITEQQAVELLKGEANGSYLVRNSTSQPGLCVIVSYIKDGTVSHTRIYKHTQGRYSFSEKLTDQSRVYNSLQSLLDAYKNEFQIAVYDKTNPLYKSASGPMEAYTTTGLP